MADLKLLALLLLAQPVLWLGCRVVARELVRRARLYAGSETGR